MGSKQIHVIHEQLREQGDDLPGAGVSNLLASLGHTGRRRVVLAHTLNTQTLMKTGEQKKSFKTILCWAAFIAILGRRWPTGHGSDTPGRGRVEIKSQDLGVRKKGKGGKEKEKDRVGSKRGEKKE